jgi:endonuclease/exonuclease/phosphatase family metal-dependent hydrolase
MVRDEAESILRETRRHVAAPRSADGVHASDRAARRLKVVQWNIEHGNRFEAIRRALHTRSELRDADVVSLNEVDLGMARSGNRDVAFDLAESLGMHAVWAPMFLELTAGRHDDSRFAGTAPNREAIFGLALLSRHPIGEVRHLLMPASEEFGFRRQRMYGRNGAIIAEILHPTGVFLLTTMHLNVHGSPPDRCEQVRLVLHALHGETRPIILAGDFNSTTFYRGTIAHGVAGLAILSGSPPARLRRRLTRPDLPPSAPREPLFRLLDDEGFRWDHYNDFSPTLRLRFDRINETEILPPPFRAAALSALRALSRRSLLRLDWIVARGFGGGRGVTVHGLDGGPDEASDHLPIMAEMEFAARSTSRARRV